MSSAPPAVHTVRLAGLDIFRGLAVAGMILVNNPGSGQHVWWPLDHATWHGFTPADMVFPAFLCAVGFALGLSFPRRLDFVERRTAWRRIARRSLGLFALGLAFALLARPDLAHWRVFGVLQRIGLCYAITASFALWTARADANGRHALSLKLFVATAFAALLSWWALLALVPAPGAADPYSPAGNIGGYIDRLLFTTDHIWRHGKDAAGNIVYDPEGLLSTLGALGNVLFGAAAAIWWRRADGRALGGIMGASVGLVVAGSALATVVPLNKQLWTSSFALLTTGLSGLLFALCVVTPPRFAGPLRVLGANALLAFCVSLLIGIAGLHTGLPALVFAQLNAVVGAPLVASAFYGVIVLAVTFALVFPLHRRGVHLRL